MRRWVAVLWHASFSIVAAGLYFVFVLPRWWELMGVTPHTLGTVMRIVAGALIGLAALPVVFTLLRSRRPEFGTPQLALNLRTWSIVLHVLAGVLIIGTAVSEIWLSLDAAGPWLFGIYGAAAAIGLLAVFTFYLAYVAETPPPPPKPLKPKAEKQRRGRRKKSADADESAPDDGDATVEESEDATAEDPTAEDASAEDATAEDASSDADAETESTTESPEPTAEDESAADETAETNGTLRNRRPSSKGEPTRRRRRRLRGGVAVDD
jgi:hypothetical protein